MNFKKNKYTSYDLLLILICLSVSVACRLSGHEKQVQKNASQHPNIIFILVDDMGWGDVGAFYQNKRKEANDPAKPWEQTPNLDSLAHQGAMLTNHYCAAPVCAPSRASLMLGLSQGHANVRDNQFDKAIEDNHTLGSVMKKTGYTTAVFGKWGLQGDSRYSENGDDWPGKPQNRGFDYFLGYMRHSDGHEHYPKEGLYSGSKQVWKNGKNIASALDKCYTADLWTAAAKKWITDHEKGDQADQPFFIYLAYDTPHAVQELPTQAYPSGGGLNGGMQWTGKKGHMINTASGQVDSWVNPIYENATYDDDGNSSTPEVPWPEVYKRYATATHRIDSAVGDLRQLLKDLHISDNTIIVFSSDNGPTRATYLNHKNRKINQDKIFNQNKPTFFRSYGPFDGIKRDTWEGGVREPTIAYWKDHIPAGKVIDFPSSQYDWLPTFTDIAGAPAPANADGVSLLPSLTGKGNQRQGLVYVEYFNDAVTPAYKDFAPQRRGRHRGQMQMIRFGKYVGVRYDVKSAQDDFQIYNVTKDPGERDNLADESEKEALFQSLQKQMKQKVLQVRMPSDSAARPYDDALIPAIKNVETAPGAEWKAFDGKFLWVPQVANLDPVETGEAKQPVVSVRPNDNEVLYFTGYIKVPKDGKYTFTLKTDTGALFRLHDATVIDADYGYKSGTEISSTILLEAGLHPFRLYYMRGNGGEPSLQFEWNGPDFSKQSIPAEAFFHKVESETISK